MESHGEALTRNAPTVDQVLDKYIQALGGAQRLAKLSSFIAKGTYSGFDTSDDKVPVEVYAKAPNQRTTILHAPVGDGVTKDGTTTFDGHAGWIYASNTLVPMLTLTGGNLDGARVDAALSFPGGIKQALTDWRDGFPATNIDGRDVDVVQGTSGKSEVKLYFDKQSGLLVRQVRYAQTIVGPNPTQMDYSDYREVAGVKLPFNWAVTWTDGQSKFEISQVQPNVPIDAGKFAKPGCRERRPGGANSLQGMTPTISRLPFPLEAVRRPLDFLQQHAMVFGNAAGHARNDHVIAGPERIPGHAAFRQLRGRGALDKPELRNALIVRSLHFHERMRIAPQELLERSFDGYALAVQVGCRGSMMREGLNAAQCQDNPDAQGCQHHTFHGYLL